jgi:hypothetical protein
MSDATVTPLHPSAAQAEGISRPKAKDVTGALRDRRSKCKSQPAARNLVMALRPSASASKSNIKSDVTGRSACGTCYRRDGPCRRNSFRRGSASTRKGAPVLR